MLNYQILTDSNQSSLASKVKAKIQKGWICQGGISVTFCGKYRPYSDSPEEAYNILLCQAMIKEGQT